MKQRRVGTLTLGLSLIFLGIIIILSLFTKIGALNLIRFSPIILIALGVEVLYYAIRYKEEKLLYDGLSIFLIIAITFVTIIASTILPLAKNAFEYERNVRLKQDEIHRYVSDELIDIQDMKKTVNVYNNISDFDRLFLKDDLKNCEIYCNVNFYNSEIIVPKDKAIELINKCVNSLKDKQKDIYEIRIRIEDKKGDYFISIPSTKLSEIDINWIEKAINEDREPESVTSNQEQTLPSEG